MIVVVVVVVVVVSVVVVAIVTISNVVVHVVYTMCVCIAPQLEQTSPHLVFLVSERTMNGEILCEECACVRCACEGVLV